MSGIGKRCDICEKNFTQIKKHNLEMHSKTRLYECDFCSKAFKRFDHLKTHKSLAHEPKKFACDVCGNTFGLEREAKKHKLTVHDKIKNYKCRICNAVFGHNSSMNNHIRRVHQIKDQM